MGVCEWRIMGMCTECAAAAHSAKVVMRRVGHALPDESFNLLARKKWAGPAV